MIFQRGERFRAQTMILGILFLYAAFAGFGGRSVFMSAKPAPVIFGTPPGATARDTKFDAETQAMFSQLVETRRDLHANPELSNREERTSKVVADRLRALGLEVKTNVARHGVVGILRGKLPGKVIAVRADMDALPIEERRDLPFKSKNKGVMHACGHDIHTTVGLGVAELLSKHKDELRGTVKFIFQPAEEGPPRGEEGGAPLMLKEGVFDDPAPDVIFGLHCMPFLEVGQVGYCESAAMASADRFLITIQGKGSHGAAPHQGVDAIVVAATAIEQLQTIRSRRIDTQEPLVISIGSVRGGSRFNIIADEVQMEGTVRTLSEEVHDRIEPMMNQVLKGVTESFGASYKLDYQRFVPVTTNNTPLVKAMLPTMQRINGAGNVQQFRAQMVSEDFAYFANRAPAIFYFLGVGNKAEGKTGLLHTAEFDPDERAIAVGVKTMSGMVADWLDAAK
jgi:amidohydrolase